MLPQGHRWPASDRSVWEGDELVTYDMAGLIWQMEHMTDDYMIDND